MKNYETMTTMEQVSFIAHSSIELVQKMYYEKNKKGLEIFLKNCSLITNHAKDCFDCIELLSKKGDTFNKIFLLIDYLGQKGINEEFIDDLHEMLNKAQEFYEQPETEEPTHEDIARGCANLRAIIDKNTSEAQE